MTNPLHYRLALDALPQLVWVAGPDGTIEYLNRRCAEYAGVAIDDLLGWDWGWVVHPADLPETLRVWNAAIRAGTPHEVEYRLRRRDGEYRWFLVRGEPVRDADGKVVRWVGTCTDIDEAKRLTDQLRSTRLLFRALVERADDGFVLAGADGTVRYANTAAAVFLDFAPGELSGTDLWGSVHPADRSDVTGWWAALLDAPGVRRTIPIRFIQRRGDSRLLDVAATNLLPDPEVRAVSIQMRPSTLPTTPSPAGTA